MVSVGAGSSPPDQPKPRRLWLGQRMLSDLVRTSFTYFKGARRAPHAGQRVTAHAAAAEELGVHSRKRRDAPAGNPPHQWRPLALPQQRTAAAARHGPRATRRTSWTPLSRRACANGAILPARPLLKPSKITVKAGLCTQDNRYRSSHQVHVHAKPTLTLIFHRFDPAPVGRTARSGCCRWPSCIASHQAIDGILDRWTCAGSVPSHRMQSQRRASRHPQIATNQSSPMSSRIQFVLGVVKRTI
jgi:hypothetical protein